ncbi:TPA: FaeA/PapI family transcriptional regulator [Serratia fonticola]
MCKMQLDPNCEPEALLNADHVIGTISHYLEACGHEGATTRQVSDNCDISIYMARNWLLRLKGYGAVEHEEVSVRKNKWFWNG